MIIDVEDNTRRFALKEQKRIRNNGVIIRELSTGRLNSMICARTAEGRDGHMRYSLQEYIDKFRIGENVNYED